MRINHYVLKIYYGGWFSVKKSQKNQICLFFKANSMELERQSKHSGRRPDINSLVYICQFKVFQKLKFLEFSVQSDAFNVCQLACQ